MGALDLHAGAFEAEAFGVADDADGGDDAIDRDVLGFAARLDGDGNAVRPFFHALDGGPGDDRHALLLEGLAGKS